MLLSKTINEIIRTSREDPKDSFQKLVKLQEEVGELADAILRRHGFKSPKNNIIEQLNEDILEEIADVVIMSVSVLSHYDLDAKALEKKIEQKFKKWKYNIKRYEEWKEVIENASNSKS